MSTLEKLEHCPRCSAPYRGQEAYDFQRCSGCGYSAVTGEQRQRRDAAMETVYRQTQQLATQNVLGATVTCPCGSGRTLIRAVRCLYCNVWLCESCAEDHFGLTRDDWRQQQSTADSMEAVAAFYALGGSGLSEEREGE